MRCLEMFLLTITYLCSAWSASTGSHQIKNTHFLSVPIVMVVYVNYKILRRHCVYINLFCHMLFGIALFVKVVKSYLKETPFLCFKSWKKTPNSYLRALYSDLKKEQSCKMWPVANFSHKIWISIDSENEATAIRTRKILLTKN